MADGEITLTRSIRNNVEKLDFDRNGTNWRVVMERAGAAEKTHTGVVLKKYPTTDEAWKDITVYARDGFKIALCSE